MNRLLRPRPRIWVSMLAATAIVATAAAAPVVQRQRRVSDELRSMARIDTLAVTARKLQHDAVQNGLTTDILIQDMIAKLSDAGYKISYDPESTPRLNVIILLNRDPNGTDTFDYLAAIELIQDVRVLRLDSELTLPTAQITKYGTARRDNLAQDIRNAIGRSMDELIKLEKIATSNL